MELRELRSLAMLAERGSISHIACELRLSPAAVHKQLKSLEAELGVRLYEKLGRRLQLTQAGELLLPYIRDLLAQYEAALSALDQWKGLRKGLVRIGTGPTISSYILPPLLRKFRSSYPALDLFVRTGQTPALIEGLRRGALDLALLVSSGLPEEADLSSEASWDYEFVLVSNLRQVPHRCALAELQRYPFILFQKGSRMENLIDRYFDGLSFRPRVIMRFDSTEAIKAMIRTGLGVSMLPFWAVDADIRKGALLLIRQKEEPLFARMDLIHRRSGNVLGPVAAFIKFAQSFKCRHPRLVSHPERWLPNLVIGPRAP